MAERHVVGIFFIDYLASFYFACVCLTDFDLRIILQVAELGDLGLGCRELRVERLEVPALLLVSRELGEELVSPLNSFLRIHLDHLSALPKSALAQNIL